MDKYIASFLDMFGEPEDVRSPGKTYIDSYRGKLPDALLTYWHELGFCRFLQGLFWIVDPGDYKDILASWIQCSSLRDSDENFYVIARSGYGDLYIWGDKSGCSYEINAMNGWIIKSDSKEEDLEKGLQLFFASKSPYSVDLEDENTGEEMFESAVEKYGPLAKDEMFGFAPTLVAGGDEMFNNLQKVNLAIHLDLIIQFKQPQVITDNDLANMAFSKK